jgi:hypothetical protein
MMITTQITIKILMGEPESEEAKMGSIGLPRSIVSNQVSNS